ncbi:MAG: hypothetical protein CL534_00080 [Ahrensia sp.]|nr:hypothetical protein [Ahrensia sp.]
MSATAVMTCLYDLTTSRKLRSTFAEDPRSALKRYSLDDDERQSIIDCDVGVLFEQGHNPMLLMGFYMLLNGPQSMPEFIDKMPTLASRMDDGKIA